MSRRDDSRINALLQSTGAGFWEWNIDSGELKIDERWAEMLGYEVSELFPFTFKKWEALLHPRDRHLNLETITNALEEKTGRYDCVVRLKHKLGGWRWIHTRGVLLEDSNSDEQWFLGSHLDVTDYKEKEHQLAQLAESLPGVIYSFVMEPDGTQRFPYMSRKTEDFYGFPPEFAMRYPNRIFDAVHPDDLDHVRETITRSYESLCEWECDYRVNINGTSRWMRGVSQPERDSDGTVTWHSMIINIDKQKQLEEELKRLSITDELTGAYNRRHILSELEAQLLEHERYGHPFSLISMDIDRFKKVNDTFGHLEGDAVLRTFADIVFKRIRKTDSFARTGGEEFIVLMPHTELADAYGLAEDLRKALKANAYKSADGQILEITLSAGVVCSSAEKCSSVSELLLACDQSLYEAKELGRNRCVAHKS
jgi:diguanylate cyclase (GGDEF)-like protein/PAS domain S-box-containing protein